MVCLEVKTSNNETKSSQKKKKKESQLPPIKLKVLKVKSTDTFPIKDCTMPVADEFGSSPANENDGKPDQKSKMISSKLST